MFAMFAPGRGRVHGLGCALVGPGFTVLRSRHVARALGLTVGAVKTRLHRARQALRALLDPALAEGA